MSDFVIPWTVAHQTPLSMEFSRQEYWSGYPFPYPGDLPDSGIIPVKYSPPASSAGRQLSAAAAVNEAVISFLSEVQMEVRLLTRESPSTEGTVSNRLLKPSSLFSEDGGPLRHTLSET